MILSAHNPETVTLEKTYLATQHDAGLTVLSVKNNDRFAANQRVLIGDMGQERTEMATVASVTGRTTITLSAVTGFAHDADDPIYVLEYDQIEIWRAASETGVYSLITTVNIDVDNTDKVTRYDDTAGTISSWYKIKYAHSVTTAETDFSDPMQATGYPASSAGKVIDSVVRRLRDTAYTVLSVDEYIDIMNEVNQDLITQTHRPYRFLKTSTTIDTVANQNYVALPTNLWKFDRLEYTRTAGGQSRSYSPNVITIERWDQRYNSSFWSASDDLTSIAIDESSNRIYLGPTPRTAQTAKIQIFYYKKFSDITGVSSVVETPNTLIYRYKMLAEYYNVKSESDNQFARLARDYEQKYGAEVVKMQRVNRLDVGTTREIKPNLGYRKRYVL